MAKYNSIVDRIGVGIWFSVGVLHDSHKMLLVIGRGTSDNVVSLTATS